MKKIILGLIVLILFAFVVKTTLAAPNQNPNQCNIHNLQNCPVPTVICGNGLHVGNPHCITPTLTPTNVPTYTPTPTPKKSCDTEHSCLRHCQPTVTPTEVPSLTPSEEVTPTSSVSATPTEVTPTEATPTPTSQPSPHGDGLSDGRESGHINAPSVPKAPPKTGRAF